MVISSEVTYLLGWAMKATTKKKNSILRLRGLGKKQWKGVDAAKHVRKERETWE